MKMTLYAGIVGGLLLLTANQAGAAEQTVKVRLTGLFARDREADLRALLATWNGCRLVRLDFDHAEVELRFDPATLLPGARPEQLITRLDERLRQGSQSTFGVKPPCPTPRDQLKRVTIPAAGLDCKACCLAAYEIVAHLDGVAQATASFREGQITALIDPRKTDQAKLEAALQARGVSLKRR